MANGTAGAAAGDGKLGTFGGVFVPNVLTILGVVMFLRIGWVVGSAGIWHALVILAIAKGITILTSLSLSAVSTNTRLGAGGAYFIVSRSLGPEAGGSVGLPLYFAQAISVAFYLVGFSESLQLLLPQADPRLVGCVALAAFIGIAWFGAGIIARTQYVILAALALSLISYFAGFPLVEAPPATLTPAYPAGHGFWTVFAVFFPAVTGIMAGVSMSGDLRDPARAIPMGTLGAVGVTLVVYAAIIVSLGLAASRETLLTNNLVMLDLARIPPLIYVGLWAATLSSALASLAAAPRTLQALAQDRVVPTFLGRGFRGSREPHIGILVSAGIAAVCIFAGNLDAIAPVITMFFLATYGTVNLVAGLERLVGNPSYRPTFKVHWSLSFLGGAGCVSVMFLIHAPSTIAAIVVMAIVFILTLRRHLRAGWGDVRSGLWFTVLRFGLIRYSASRPHVRNWRPVFLVLSGNPQERLPMIDFADAFEASRGFLFLGQVVKGDEDDVVALQPRFREHLVTFIREHELSAAPMVVVADDFVKGVTTMLQTTGVGSFQPDTVLVGWSDDLVKRATFGRAVRRVLEMQRNLLVHEAPEPGEKKNLRPTIDVWWYSRDNGSFMLTLAYLLRLRSEWSEHQLRVLRIIRDADGIEEARTGMAAIMVEQRVGAEVQIIVSTEPPLDVIGRTSEHSAVCFVGMAVKSIADSENPMGVYEALVAKLKGNVFLAKSWHDLQY
ncbi:MAG: hypothetical protein HUU15_08580 [Candidatus Brocadiae bacterium]|nr:hypothetical protein [Candidatus Brocadiia bacterium]